MEKSGEGKLVDTGEGKLVDVVFQIVWSALFGVLCLLLFMMMMSSWSQRVMGLDALSRHGVARPFQKAYLQGNRCRITAGTAPQSNQIFFKRGDGGRVEGRPAGSCDSTSSTSRYCHDAQLHLQSMSF
jgi:hypothetical protein